MNKTTPFRVRIFAFSMLFVLSSWSWSQEVSYRELRWGISGSYEYALLENFNEEFVKKSISGALQAQHE